MGRKIYFTGDANFNEQLEDLAEIDEFAAALWPWMLTYMDDWGRGPFNLRRIKEQAFGQFPSVDQERTEEIVRLFDRVGLLSIYEAKGHAYIAIEAGKWFKYQTHIHHSKRTNDKSSYPAPYQEVFDMELKREKSRRIAENRGIARDIAENRASLSLSSLPPFHPSKDEEENAGGREGDLELPAEDWSQFDIPADDEQKPDILSDAVTALYRQTMRIYPNTNSLQLEKLAAYVSDDGMEGDAVMLAVEESKVRGKDLYYAFSILRRWVEREVKTVEQAREQMRLFQEGIESGANRRNHNRDPGADQATPPKRARIVIPDWQPPADLGG